MTDKSEVPAQPSTANTRQDCGFTPCLTGVEEHLDGPYDFQYSQVDKWNNPTGSITRTQGVSGTAVGIKAQMRSFYVPDGKYYVILNYSLF